jgi:hypothetical protein
LNGDLDSEVYKTHLDNLSEVRKQFKKDARKEFNDQKRVISDGIMAELTPYIREQKAIISEKLKGLKGEQRPTIRKDMERKLSYDVAKMKKERLKSFNLEALKKDIYDDFDTKANERVKQLDDELYQSNQEKLPEFLGDGLLEVYADVRATIDHNANELVDLGILSEDEKIRDYVKRYYQEYVQDQKTFQTNIGINKMFQRNKRGYDEAVEQGLVEDAGFTIANTIAEQNILIQKAKVLKKLADEFGMDDFDFDNGLVPDDYAKLSNETVKAGVKKWGALSGMYIPKELKKELIQARMMETELSQAMNNIYAVVDHIKVNVTVKNPATHLYNFASNLMLSFLNGDFLEVGKTLYLRATNPTEFKKLLDKANQYGLNSHLDDMEKPHLELLPKTKKKVGIVQTMFKELYMAENTKTGNFARKLYDWEDKIFKLSSFKKNLDAGMDEKTAFKKATEVYVDYSTPLPSALKFVDKGGFMPFLHYQYKATPAVAKTMLKHPMRTAILATGIATIGGLKQQDEDDKYLKPEWARDKFNMFDAKEWVRMGDGTYWNFGRMIPGTKLDMGVDFGFWGGMYNILNEKTPQGYNITRATDNENDVMTKQLLTTMENYLPSLTYGRYMQRVAGVGLGEAGVIEKPLNRVTNKPDTIGDIASRAVGVREFDESAEARRSIKEKKRLITNLKKEKKEVLESTNLNKTAKKIKSNRIDNKIEDAKDELKEVEESVKKGMARFNIDINNGAKKSRDSFTPRFDIMF